MNDRKKGIINLSLRVCSNIMGRPELATWDFTASNKRAGARPTYMQGNRPLESVGRLAVKFSRNVRSIRLNLIHDWKMPSIRGSLRSELTMGNPVRVSCT